MLTALPSSSAAIPATADGIVPLLVQRSMFWKPAYSLDLSKADYIPLIFWLTDIHRPNSLVELGPDTAAFYFAFCQSIERLGLAAQCFAIDEWTSESRSGSTYETVESYNASHYGAFSTILKMSPPKAKDNFVDRSVDLLQLNLADDFDKSAFHFDDWLPKLSDKAIVLVYGTSVGASPRAARELVATLKNKYPSFEFLHGRGMTIFCVGDSVGPISHLFSDELSPLTKQTLCDMFARLGQACIDAQLAARYLDQAQSFQINGSTPHSSETNSVQSIDNSKVTGGETSEAVELREKLKAAEALVIELRQELKDTTTNADNLRKFLEQIKSKFSDQSNELIHTSRALADSRVKEERLAREMVLLTQMFLKIKQPTSNVVKGKGNASNVNEHASGIKNRGDSILTPPKRHRKLSRLLREVLGSGSIDSRKRAKEREAIAMLATSELFDEKWYLNTYPDAASSNLHPVEHYLRIGAKAGHNPSKKFNTLFYLQTYEDVAQAGVNPLVHYLKFGKNENRRPTPR